MKISLALITGLCLLSTPAMACEGFGKAMSELENILETTKRPSTSPQQPPSTPPKSGAQPQR